MKYPAYILLILGFMSFGTSSCQSQPESEETVTLIKYEDLFNEIQKQDDKLYVVNFWATWCVPCVKELPEFMAVNQQYAENPNFKMILVSLDFAKNKDSLVAPFVEANDISTDVYLLDDAKRMDTWINMVDANWSGAIPATLMYKNGKKVFFKEGTMTQEELENIIQNNL